MFDKNSGLVSMWVSLIGEKTYTIEQCPNLSNLKEIVTEVVNATAQQKN